MENSVPYLLNLVLSPMPRTIVYILLLCFGLVSCTDDTLTKAPEPARHTIELVAFGFADNPTEENKGFGVAYYCYADLDTDSVFIQYRTDSRPDYITIAKTGTIKGLSKEPRILAYQQAIAKYENGTTLSTPIEEGALYCGPTYYSKYTNKDGERFHFYTTHGLDNSIELATRFLVALQSDSRLTDTTPSLDEDKVTVPVVNLPGFNFRPPPQPLPPPPARAKAK
ncbi:hypothetical protein [Pontibacter burrus]|uniref:Uncharacterized protein n=1 Tax=Pontibacter burrus TaxID=2704466 RepID=A0A6B3LTE0_9BACT|nr:hypothetical protein [Pontibacter burrus]NEM96837.1 hypothetical protein [Pontibacter burrus]